MSDSRLPTEKITESVVSGTDGEIRSVGSFSKKPFRELFSRDELWHYGIAAAVYIVLGVLLRDIVLNWIIGPLFVVAWMWWVPPMVDKWMEGWL